VGQWNLGPVKDRPGGQRNLVSAFGALVTPSVHQFVRSFVPASRTTEPLRPTACRQIFLASLFCGEVGPKLAKRLGERWSGHPYTLPIGACCSNRIIRSNLDARSRIVVGDEQSFDNPVREGLPISRSQTIRVAKDCGVSRELHSFDKNDCSRRGIFAGGEVRVLRNHGSRKQQVERR
jgi:hypothetical protein